MPLLHHAWRQTLLAAAAALAAAVDMDPSGMIHQERCLNFLSDLDKALANAPATDPRLARAEMALVDLALCGDVRNRGANGGIWRQRARELRDLRAAAGVPVGAAAKTFVDAVPDLWVDALDAKSAACLDALAKFPASANDPQARALRCYATGDWRELKPLTGLGPHEQVALAIAYLRAGMAQAVETMDHSAMPALTYASIEHAAMGFSHEGSAACLREAVVRTALLAVSPDLPPSAATAAAAVTALVPDDGQASAVTTGRLRWAMFTNNAWEQGASVLAVWNLAEAACAGPTGLRDAQGNWRMGALGDRAAQARLELCQGMWHRHDFLRNMLSAPEESAALSTAVQNGDPGWFGAFHRLIEAQWRDDSALTAFGDGIDAELAHGPGMIPPVRLIGVVNEVRTHFPAYAGRAEEQERKLAALHAQAEAGRGAGWGELGWNLAQIRHLAWTADGFTAAAAADPWSPELARDATEVVDGSIPLWTAAPNWHWTDATVDVPRIDMQSRLFANPGHTDRLGARWTGTLTVPAAGAWRLATESDDGSTLTIDGKLLCENGGSHPMQRVSGTLDLTAGAHAIDLRWFNWYGGAGVRLLWQPPGADDFTVIPTTALSTPDRQPGLLAQEWLLQTTPAEIPDQAVLDACMERMPWRLNLLSDRLQQYWQAQRWEDALACGQKVVAVDPGNPSCGKAVGDCLDHLGRTDEAIAAWESYINASSAFNVIFARMAVARALEKKGDLAGAEQYGKDAADSWQANAMLDFGDFLARRGRVREGLVWLDRCDERYGGSEAAHAATLLLSQADPPAADIDEAFKRLAAHPDAVTQDGNRAWNLCSWVQNHALHDRFLALATPHWRDVRNGLAVKLGVMLAETGHAAEGAELLDQVRARGELNDNAVGWVGAWQTLAARLAKRPDLAVAPDDLRARIGHGTWMPAIDTLLRYMAGDLDRTAALAAVPKPDDALELQFYLGVDAIARGDLTQARADLTPVTQREKWTEHGEARRLLAWLDAGQPGATTPAIAAPTGPAAPQAPPAPGPAPAPAPAPAPNPQPANKDF
jgi:tetratricopeptide (TPR) repeat protein